MDEIGWMARGAPAAIATLRGRTLLQYYQNDNSHIG
jgi:hypothetical protein